MNTSNEVAVQKTSPVTEDTSAKASQVLLSSKFINHHPKAGINPLVDAAGYLFSVLGKLRQLKSYRHLQQLQKELIDEIHQFQELVSGRGYGHDFILVSRYSLCLTFDDVIA